MNRTPRVLNRVILGLLGLLLLVLGAHLSLVSLVPAYAQFVRPALDAADGALRSSAAQADVGGTSWLWLGVCAVCVVLIVLVIVWALMQGRGRVTTYSRELVREGPERGVVETMVAVPEALIKQELFGREDLLSVAVSAWETGGVRKGTAGLRIKIQPRPGADPARIVADVDAIVGRLEHVLGTSGPVVLQLVTGARAKFARTERVR